MYDVAIGMYGVKMISTRFRHVISRRTRASIRGTPMESPHPLIAPGQEDLESLSVNT